MMVIGEERPGDRAGIRAAVAAAFGRADEADLVDRLRADGDSVISLVATLDDKVVGHAMFSRVTAPFRALALAPVSVVPDRQGAGIGAALILSGLDDALDGGWQGVFVLGEPDYYRRFGFDRDLARSFASPYQGPYLMVHPLGGTLPALSGEIVHPPAFAAV